MIPKRRIVLEKPQPISRTCLTERNILLDDRHQRPTHQQLFKTEVIEEPNIEYYFYGVDKYFDSQKQEKRKRTRNPSPYNIFMSKEIRRVKSNNPLLGHKLVFKMAANNWSKIAYQKDSEISKKPKSIDDTPPSSDTYNNVTESLGENRSISYGGEEYKKET